VFSGIKLYMQKLRTLFTKKAGVSKNYARSITPKRLPCDKRLMPGRRSRKSKDFLEAI